MFCVCISDWSSSLNRHSCNWKKSSQHLQDDNRVTNVGYQENTCRSWHPSLLPGFHVVSYFDSTFLSWVVYCGYIRPWGCLLSPRLWPITVMNSGSQKNKKQKTKTKTKKTLKFLTLLESVILLFLCLFLKLSCWTSFRCSDITFMLLYLLPYFKTLFPLKLVIS